MKPRELAAFSFALIWSGLSLTLSLGLLAQLVQSPNLLTATGAVVGIGFLIPIKFFYRNMDELSSTFIDLFEQKKIQIEIGTMIFLLGSFSFLYGLDFPGSSLINLSFHSSAQLFFPVKVLYSEIVGLKASFLIFSFGRWYLHLIWSYLIADLGYSAVSELFKKAES